MPLSSAASDVYKRQELILKSHKSINEIADEVGYSSISNFSDTFHEFTQSRPSDLRKTKGLSLIHISEPTRHSQESRMPASA
nr:helix-turn-helix domain-containing protein [Elizabethkingia sp. ASV34]